MKISNKAATLLLRTSAALWAVWGAFHLVLGVAIVALLAQEHPNGLFEAIPGLVTFDMGGQENTFAVIASLKQHGYNLAWIGGAVTVGCVYVWKRRRAAIISCAVLGGFADLGYFVFNDLPGYAEPPGPQMTYICAAAIATSMVAYLATDRLRTFADAPGSPPTAGLRSSEASA